MKVLVFGGWFGSGNIGDDAILIGVRDVLRSVIHDVEFLALSINPKQTRKICGVEAISLQSPKQLLRNNTEYFDAFNEVDAVIVTGGTPIYDYDHLSRLIHMGIPILKRKPLILFGIGAKPIYTLRGRSVLKTLLRHASLISVRDVPSANILLKITDKPVTVTGDSALCINNLEKKRGAGEPIAIICPRFLSMNNKPLYHEKISAKGIDCVRRAIARFADTVSDTHIVKFIPFHTMYLDDDRKEIAQIKQLLKTDRFKELEKPLSPEFAFNLLCEADILIGLRLHSLILGALARLPLVSVNYDRKIHAFMNLINLHDYVCSLNDLYSDSVIDKANDAFMRTLDIQKTIDDSLRLTRNRILNEAVRVREHLAAFQ